MRRFHRFKSMLLCTLFCGFILTLTAAEGARKKIEVFIEPSSVRTGETAYFVIRSNDGARNRPLSALPAVPGLRWAGGMSQSSRVSIVNGKRSSVYEVRIPFVTEKAGTYTVPAMNLSHAKEKTPPLTFTVQESTYTLPPAKGKENSSNTKGETLTLSQLLKVDLAVPGKRKFYYLGEEIPVDIYVHALQNMQIELTWPKLLFSDPASAVLLDYRKTNPENPSYAGVVRSARTIRDKKYESFRFATAFRALRTGKMTLTAEENAIFTLPEDPSSRRRGRSAEDFLDEFWGGSIFSSRRRVTRSMKSTPLELEIRKLPPVPQGVFFTGLVGPWKCRTTLSAPPYKAGEPLTLTIHFELPSGSGLPGASGSSVLLRPPVFQSTLFRSYAPEMEKGESSAVIRYVLIPTAESDGKKINLQIGPWATFDPLSARYIVNRLERSLVVEKGSAVILPGNSAPVVVDPAAAVSSGKGENPKKNRNVEDVLYLKRVSGKNVVLPLWKNALAGGVVLLLISGGFLFLSVILSWRRSLLDNDVRHIRRTRAAKLKKALLKKIASSDISRITGEYSGEIASYVADACDLEPGSDLMECAKALKEKDPALSRVLSELADCVWTPGKKEDLPEGFIAHLVKLLGKVCCLALLLLPLSMRGAESMPGAASPETVPVQEEEAMRSYDRGKFSLALQYYKNLLRQGHLSAELLYNLGNCYYKMGKLHSALICYERALRLDSRDPDILENLNLVRRKLGLEERYRITSPADTLPYLRDMLTMDEWLLMIFMGIGTLFAAGGYFLLCGDTRSFRLVTALGVCWALLSFWAFLAQGKSIYDPDRALVMQKDLKVYSLPSSGAGKVEMKLHAGEEVRIVERRMEWLRIRSGNAEGWVHVGGVMPLWNSRSMQDLAAHPE